MWLLDVGSKPWGIQCIQCTPPQPLRRISQDHETNQSPRQSIAVAGVFIAMPSCLDPGRESLVDGGEGCLMFFFMVFYGGYFCSPQQLQRFHKRKFAFR